jgi:hypothetical protein
MRKRGPGRILLRAGLPQCSSSLKGSVLVTLNDGEETRIERQEELEGKNWRIQKLKQKRIRSID